MLFVLALLVIGLWVYGVALLGYKALDRESYAWGLAALLFFAVPLGLVIDYVGVTEKVTTCVTNDFETTCTTRSEEIK